MTAAAPARCRPAVRRAAAPGRGASSSSAQLDGAAWNLDKTVVRAPADGYVTNLALRKGARVASLPLSPVMAFIDTSDTIIGVEIAQIDARYIEPGQKAEVTFKFWPARSVTGRVETVLQAISTGQVQPSGLAVTPKQVQSAPFVVRVDARRCRDRQHPPAGTTGEAAIFTDHVKAAHVIRRVMLRMTAIYELYRAVLSRGSVLILQDIGTTYCYR